MKELRSMHDDIENNSDFVNYKDCRPGMTAGSTLSGKDTNVAFTNKSIKNANSMAIEKSTKERESSKKQFVDQY